MEKTPSNSYCFNAYLRTFETGKVIHTARDPYETICSLMRRGMSPYFASALWLYNSCAALAASDSTRYLLLRYEDLTSNPAKEVRTICDFLGLDFDESMLLESRFDTTDHTSNDGWRYSRNDKITKSGLEFETLEEGLKNVILTCLSVLEVSQKHAERLGMKSRNCDDACTQLGYEFRKTQANPESARSLKFDQFREIIWRSSRLSPTGFGNFPVSFRTK